MHLTAVAILEMFRLIVTLILEFEAVNVQLLHDDKCERLFSLSPSNKICVKSVAVCYLIRI